MSPGAQARGSICRPNPGGAAPPGLVSPRHHTTRPRRCTASEDPGGRISNQTAVPAWGGFERPHVQPLAADVVGQPVHRLERTRAPEGADRPVEKARRSANVLDVWSQELVRQKQQIVGRSTFRGEGRRLDPLERIRRSGVRCHDDRGQVGLARRLSHGDDGVTRAARRQVTRHDQEPWLLAVRHHPRQLVAAGREGHVETCLPEDPAEHATSVFLRVSEDGAALGHGRPHRRVESGEVCEATRDASDICENRYVVGTDGVRVAKGAVDRVWDHHHDRDREESAFASEPRDQVIDALHVGIDEDAVRRGLVRLPERGARVGRIREEDRLMAGTLGRRPHCFALDRLKRADECRDHHTLPDSPRTVAALRTGAS